MGQCLGKTPKSNQPVRANPISTGQLEFSFDLSHSRTDALNISEHFEIHNETDQLLLPYAFPHTPEAGNPIVPPTMALDVGKFTGQKTLPINEEQLGQQDLGLMLNFVEQSKKDVRETQEALEMFAEGQKQQMEKLQLFEGMIKQMIGNHSDGEICGNNTTTFFSETTQERLPVAMGPPGLFPPGIMVEVAKPTVPQEDDAHVSHTVDSLVVLETENVNVQEEEQQDINVAELAVLQEEKTDVSPHSDSSFMPGDVQPNAEGPNQQHDEAHKAAAAQLTLKEVRQGKIHILIEKCEALVVHFNDHFLSESNDDPFHHNHSLEQLSLIYHYQLDGSKKHCTNNRKVKKFLSKRQRLCVQDSGIYIFYAMLLQMCESKERCDGYKVFACFLRQNNQLPGCIEKFEAEFIGQLDTFYKTFLTGRLEQYLSIQGSRLANEPVLLKNVHIDDWTQQVQPAYSSVKNCRPYKENKFFKSQVDLWRSKVHLDESFAANYLYFEFLLSYKQSKILNRDFAYFEAYPDQWDLHKDTYLKCLFESSRFCVLKC